MKQVDFKEFNIEGIKVMLLPKWPRGILERIHSVAPPDKDGESVFSEVYKVGNVNHFAVALVVKRKKDEIYRVGVGWETGRLVRVPKGRASVSKLFEIMSSIKEKVPVVYELRLLFRSREKYKTIINLPIRVTDMAKAPYDEIHGMHFMKRVGKHSKYHVKLELLKNGALSLSIDYEGLVDIKESILEDILEEGIRISKGFVLRERK